MTTMTEQPTRPPPQAPQTPAWVGWIVAGLILTSVVAIVGWVVWSYVSGPKQSELVEVDPGFGGRRVLPGGRQQPRVVINREGVKPRGPNSFGATAGEVLLSASKGANDKDWSLVLNYSRPDVPTPEQTRILSARYRLSNDANYAKALKVSDEQVKKLRDLGPATNMALNDSDRARIKAAWEAYLAAGDKTGPEQELMKAMREVGGASLEATKKQIVERCQQVQQILTPEQLAEFNK
jgi:hypothetical protein